MYPFSFSVVVNSILVSFPFLVAFVTYLIFKNNAFKRNADFLVNILNFHNLKFIIDSNLNRMVPVKDLKEGAIVNEYQFNDEYVSELINEMDANLKVYRNGDDCEFKYCFKSQSAGGITKEEMYLLKIMNAQGFIGDEISVKPADNGNLIDCTDCIYFAFDGLWHGNSHGHFRFPEGQIGFVRHCVCC